MNAKSKEHLIGTSLPRKEGRKKVTGQSLYIDDRLARMHSNEPRSGGR